MTFSSTFGRTFSPTFQSKSQAAASGGWWDLDGAIDSCVAAYQPKGAGSYAASLVNLTGNATYDATEGVAPNWDSVTGWDFDEYKKYLKTGVVPNGGNYSVIFKFSTAITSSSTRLLGAESGSVRFFVIPHYNGAIFFANGPTVIANEYATTSGVIAMANRNCFLDGSQIATLDSYSGTISQEIYINKVNDDGSPVGSYQHIMAALAIYNADISSYVAALTTAMNAL